MDWYPSRILPEVPFALLVSCCCTFCFRPQVCPGKHYHPGRVCWWRRSQPFLSTRPATAAHLQLAVQHWNQPDSPGLLQQLSRLGAQRRRPLERSLPGGQGEQRPAVGWGASVLQQPLGTPEHRRRQSDRKPDTFEYSSSGWSSQWGVHLGNKRNKMEITIISTKGKIKIVTLSSPGLDEESSFNRSDWQPFLVPLSNIEYETAEVLVNCSWNSMGYFWSVSHANDRFYFFSWLFVLCCLFMFVWWFSKQSIKAA